MSIEKFKGRYRVRWRDETGRQRAKSFPFMAEAKSFEHRLHAGLLVKGELPPRRGSTFRELAERWFTECVILKSPGTGYQYRRFLDAHLIPRWGDIPTDELTFGHATALRAELLTTKGLRPISVNSVLTVARKIFEDAIAWDLIERNPLSRLKRLEVPDRQFDYWLPDERDRYLAYCRTADPEFHDLVAVAVHTGLRLGELLGLNWDAVDGPRQVLIVRRSRCQHSRELREQTKTKRIREVPMNRLIVRILEARRGLGKAGDQAVFGPQNARSTSGKHRLLCKRAGVKPIRFHDLRHTFASLMAMAGVDLALLRELLGHSSYTQTLRYAHLHPSRITGATECLCGGESVSGPKGRLQPIEIK